MLSGQWPRGFWKADYSQMKNMQRDLPSKSSPSASASPSGQQPYHEAAQPQPSPSMPDAGVFRSGQQPNSVSLQLHPSWNCQINNAIKDPLIRYWNNWKLAWQGLGFRTLSTILSSSSFTRWSWIRRIWKKVNQRATQKCYLTRSSSDSFPIRTATIFIRMTETTSIAWSLSRCEIVWTATMFSWYASTT